MTFAVIVYLIFAFYFSLVAIIFGSFVMFNRIKTKDYFWNKKQGIILFALVMTNLPLQLTILILATAKKSYNFNLSSNDALTTDNKIAISLLVITIALLVSTVIYSILVSDYLAIKFDNKYLFIFGRKVAWEKVFEVSENDNGYFVLRYLEGSRAKRKVSWNLKSPTAKFIIENYQTFINEKEDIVISEKGND